MGKIVISRGKSVIWLWSEREQRHSNPPENPPALRVEVTGLAHKASGLSPASFRSYVLSTVFRRNAAFETDHGIRQIRLICEWDLSLACLIDPH